MLSGDWVRCAHIPGAVSAICDSWHLELFSLDNSGSTQQPRSLLEWLASSGMCQVLTSPPEQSLPVHLSTENRSGVLG